MGIKISIETDPQPEKDKKDHQLVSELVDDPEELKKEEPIDELDEVDYLAELTKRKKAKIKETFDIERNLHKQMNALAKKYGYGFKTRFINSAIKRELERLKKMEELRGVLDGEQ